MPECVQAEYPLPEMLHPRNVSDFSYFHILECLHTVGSGLKTKHKSRGVYPI